MCSVVQCELVQDRKERHRVTKYSQRATLCNTFLGVKGRYGGRADGTACAKNGKSPGFHSIASTKEVGKKDKRRRGDEANNLPDCSATKSNQKGHSDDSRTSKPFLYSRLIQLSTTAEFC